MLKIHKIIALSHELERSTNRIGGVHVDFHSVDPEDFQELDESWMVVERKHKNGRKYLVAKYLYNEMSLTLFSKPLKKS